jgi:hypothetical protein
MHRRRLLLVVVAVAVLLFASPVLIASPSATPATSQRQSALSASQFLGTVVQALAQAHLAILAINDLPSDSSLSKRMTATKIGRIEIGIASTRMSQLKRWQNDNATASRDGIVDVFALYQKSLDIQLAGYEKVDAATKVEDLAGIRRGISDAATIYHEATLALFDAVTVCFGSLVIADPNDPEKRTVLNMTATERAALLKQMEAAFGPEVAKVNSTHTGPMQAAGILYSNLAKWRTLPG